MEKTLFEILVTYFFICDFMSIRVYCLKSEKRKKKSVKYFLKAILKILIMTL
jgi:hypothetical protein